MAGTPKNFGGRALIAIATPNYKDLGKRLAATEAARLALLKILKQS